MSIHTTETLSLLCAHNRAPLAAAAVVDMRLYNELLEPIAEPDVSSILHCMTEQVCLCYTCITLLYSLPYVTLLQVCTTLAEGNSVQSIAPSGELDKDLSRQLNSILSELSPVPSQELKKVKNIYYNI